MFSKNFICRTHEKSSYENFIPAPYFRRSFEIEKDVQCAEITLCGLGFYELFINGERITKGFLAPYISNPDEVLYYDKYNVLPHLKKGKNVIALLLGNGMVNAFGAETWKFTEGEFCSSPKFAMDFCATLSSNEKISFCADESFKTAPSPILLDDLRCGEYYDANFEIKNWNKTEFDDSKWENAIKAQTPKGKPTLCSAEPIVITREISPVKVYPAKISKVCSDKPIPEASPFKNDTQTEGYLYDFGVNAAGLCRLKINGKKGQRVIMQFGELLDSNGNLDLSAMLYSPAQFAQKDVYVCKGGEETYMPSFTYHGFRYCLVIGIDENQAKEDLLTYCVMNSDLEIRSEFNCSNEIINKLWDAALVSDLANFYYFPTDCPHREKNGWTGDAAVSAEHFVLNLSCENSLREWMKNIRAAQRESGIIPCIIPTATWGYSWGNGPAWDNAIVEIPYQIYKYRGDISVFSENAKMIEKYLHYLKTKVDENGLIHYGLGDWCQAGEQWPDNYSSPLEFTDTVISMDILRKSAFLFKKINFTEQKEFAESFYNQLYSTAREKLINKESLTALGDCQTSQAMALYFRLFTKEEEVSAFEHLVRFIKEKDGLMITGMLGTRVIFHVLSKFNRSDLALKMITDKRVPSYASWINSGCTSLCEAFIPIGKYPISLNHHFFGDISSWFMQNILGIKINPESTDCKSVLINPHFIPSLSFAKGKTKTVCGEISVSWKRDGDTISLSVFVPEGLKVSLSLPQEFKLNENSPKTLKAGENNFTII